MLRKQINSNSKNPLSVKYRRWGVEKIYYISRKLYINRWIIFSFIFKYFNIFMFRAYIPPQAAIGARLELPHGGFGVVINEDVIIGDDAVILHNVTIGNGGARIGNRVYIGTGATIIGSVNIGDDVVIGANVVITFDVPSKAYVSAPKGKIFEKVRDNAC